MGRLFPYLAAYSMDHAKKYILVDPQMYRPSMPEKSLSGLDHEIQATLNGDLPDDQKAKLYMITLKKYRAHDGSTKPAAPKIDLDSELADSLPPTEQYKAKKLMRLIRDNPDIDWSRVDLQTESRTAVARCRPNWRRSIYKETRGRTYWVGRV